MHIDTFYCSPGKNNFWTPTFLTWWRHRGDFICYLCFAWFFTWFPKVYLCNPCVISLKSIELHDSMKYTSAICMISFEFINCMIQQCILLQSVISSLHSAPASHRMIRYVDPSNIRYPLSHVYWAYVRYEFSDVFLVVWSWRGRTGQ